MKSEKKMTIKDWALSDRPREKLILNGKRSLTDSELLAILIGSGNHDETAVDLCKRILYQMDDDLEKLANLTVPDLCKFKGVGEAKAITIIAALELCYRRSAPSQKELIKINSSQDSFKLLQRYFTGLKQEQFWIILLNRASKLIGIHQISTGSTSETLVDPKLIFPLALEHHASAMVIAHNHPSDILKPSEMDIELTKRLCASAQMLDIFITDHLIFGENKYFSFSDHGMMPDKDY